MKSKTHYLRLLAQGTLRHDAVHQSLGFQLSAADTDETVLDASAGDIYIVELIASVPAGLTATTVTVKNGTIKLLEQSIDPGTSVKLLSNSRGLLFRNDLVMQATDTEPIINAWAMLP